MTQSLVTRGFLSDDDIAAMEADGRIPSAARRREGPIAVMECVQQIPCNPCESSCKSTAITIGEDITNTPAIDTELCHGCGICVSACPGQAVFIVDESETHKYGADRALVTMPYEFTPLPAKGDVVTALTRAGNALGDAEVVRVLSTKSMDATAQVTIAVPKEWAMQARFFKRKEA